MKRKIVLLFVAGLVTLCAWPALNAWAGGAGGEGDASCVFKKKDIEPPGIKLTGTVAVSANVNSGTADVIFRLERTDEVHFFRALYQSTPPFTAPTLLAAQTRLCEILNIPGLAANIIGAFNLNGTTLVTTPKGIRNTQVIPSVDCTQNPKADECKVPGLQFESDPPDYVTPGSNPARGTVISDVILYVQ
jgi:hypothetical protein